MTVSLRQQNSCSPDFAESACLAHIEPRWRAETIGELHPAGPRTRRTQGSPKGPGDSVTGERHIDGRVREEKGGKEAKGPDRVPLNHGRRRLWGRAITRRGKPAGGYPLLAERFNGGFARVGLMIARARKVLAAAGAPLGGTRVRCSR